MDFAWKPIKSITFLCNINFELEVLNIVWRFELLPNKIHEENEIGRANVSIIQQQNVNRWDISACPHRGIYRCQTTNSDGLEEGCEDKRKWV